MNGAKDIRSYGYKVGSIPCGKANLITDVPGVKVGHCTVEENGHKTGVTAVIPCDGNVFVKKPVASVFTLNGYGKTAGTIQIEELGVIEYQMADKFLHYFAYAERYAEKLSDLCCDRWI